MISTESDLKPLSFFSFFIALTLQIASAQSAPANKKPLTIEAIFAEGSLTGRAPETMKWSPDGKMLSYVQRDDSGDHGELWYVDAATGEKKVLVSESKLATLAPSAEKIKDEREKERVTRYNVAAYNWSPDSKHLLFDSQGQLWLYSLESGAAVQITSSPDPSGDPKFSPDGSRLAFVRKHNLFVQTVDGKSKTKALTKDTDENLLNGEVDWVYAEELGVRSNYFWSPGGSEVAFLQMDETSVPTYPITDWMPTHPNVDKQKYPKAGDPNPAVRLGVVDADGGKVKWVTLTKDPEFYIPRFGWIRDGWLWAQVLNREQNTMDLYFIDSRSGKSRKVLTESSPDAWVNVNDDFHVLKSGDRFLWSSWRDGHTHLYLYSFGQSDPLSADAKLENQLEKGDYEVIQVDGIDEQGGAVLFTSNQDDPRQNQLYSVKFDGTGLTRLSKDEGTYASIVSDDGKHYAATFSSSNTPPRSSLCTVGGTCQVFWESRNVADYSLIDPKFLDFKADDGTILHGYVLLPPNATGKVPLIVDVYGGPAGQTVTRVWGGTTGLFHQYLLTQGFAIFSVDNRGTPNRGKKFSAATRHQFGGVELKDQLTAIDQLLPQYPQIDRDRIGIWGWSNGASMTLYALTHSDRFKAGVAVSPVTDWHNYDSIYTERYMGLLKDNLLEYDKPITKDAPKLHGALFLAHGTSDDNVHFQNSVQMIDALIKAGKQFHLMIYPNKTHGIAGSAARSQLFHLMEEHWERELK
jgi:dipeptidyl-peptidase-4